MPESIIDLWEKYNITNGADILLVSIACKNENFILI